VRSYSCEMGQALIGAALSGNCGAYREAGLRSAEEQLFYMCRANSPSTLIHYNNSYKSIIQWKLMVLALESGTYKFISFPKHALKNLDCFTVHGYIALEYPDIFDGKIRWLEKECVQIEKEVNERFGDDKTYTLGTADGCAHTLVLSRK
ncbi:MAG: hypothetical protein AABX59_03210, partial [Nanoarchaeota archaeon]